MSRRRPPSRQVVPKQRVALRWDHSLRGCLIASGPEQSEVLLDGERAARTFINGDLVRLVRRERESRRG